MINLSYYDLIDPTPYNYKDICHIRAVTLRDISCLENKYDTYKTYINLFSLDVEDYYKFTEQSTEDIVEISKAFERIGKKPNIYDLISITPTLLNELIVALNFFIVEEVAFDTSTKELCIMAVDDDGDIVPYKRFGAETYYELIDVINQRHAVARPSQDDKIENQVFKNARAREIWVKTHNPEVKKLRDAANINKYNLGNIVSALTAKSKTISIINVWDVSVFNIYDQFDRIRVNAVDEINARAVSIWGDSDKKYNYESWYENRKES